MPLNPRRTPLSQGLSDHAALADFFNLSPSLLCVADADGYFRHVNPSFMRVLGYRETELLEKPYLSFVHPDDRDATRHEMACLNEGQPSLGFENRYRCKDGSYRLLSWNAYPRPDGLIHAIARDVTETREQENELRYLASLLDHVSDAVVSTDHAFRIVSWNTAAESLYGLSFEDVRGCTFYDFAHAEYLSGGSGTQTLYRLREAGQWSGEIAFHLPGERVVYVESKITRVTDPAGNTTGYVAVNRDITEAYLLRQRLHVTEAQARLLAEVARRTQNGVVITDLDGCITWVNEGFTQLSGYTLEEVIGRKPGHVLQGPESDPATVARLRAYIRRREPVQAELVNYHKDGRTYWAAVDIAPLLGPNGQPVGFMGIERDVTAQRETVAALEEAQHHLYLALEAGQVGLWEWDIRSGTVRRSPNTAALLGFDAEDANFPLTHFLDHVHEEDRPRIQTAIERAVKEGTPFNEIYRWRSRDDIRWLHDVGRVYYENDEPVRMLGAEKDITELKLHEEMLRRAKETAEEMSRLKSEILTNMSHELRTPLVGIIGFSELLVDQVPPDAVEFVNLIHESGTRLLDTLGSVLDLAQLESGGIRLSLSSFDLSELIEEVTRAYQRESQIRGVALHVDPIPPGIFTITSDRSAITRILSHLLSNAFKFTQAGQVRIAVRQTPDRYALLVQDTGVGISEEFLPYLFEEFRQESSGLGRNYEGSGIGLAITKRLVELLGGAITVKSRKGQGTSFTVTLPKALTEPVRKALDTGSNQ